jgi:gas vesicle protein
MTPTPVQQMKSIITANLQQLKSIDSSSPKTVTRHDSISLLANKTDARHSTSLNTSTPVHFIVHCKKSVKAQLNENSVQKVAVISSTDNCARLVRDDQKKIQEQIKREISSNNSQFQILSEIQPSQKEMSEQSSAVSSHIDFQLAPRVYAL